ncbi:MAG: MoaD/ThiS family protein [Gammaproteobacteria bacterium]
MTEKVLIEVRYFASLRERVGCDQETVTMDHGATVSQVWSAGQAEFALPANMLCAINEEYAGLDDPVSTGDQVAFFPPVTGG